MTSVIVMNSAGFAFAVATGAELCLKIFKELTDKYEAHKTAEDGVAQRILILQNHWFRLEEEIVIVKNSASSLTVDQQIHFKLQFSHIQVKLREAADNLDCIIGRKSASPTVFELSKKRGKIRRSKYAFSIKDSLDTILTDLKNFHENLAQSVLLLTRSSNQEINKKISQYASSESGPGGILKFLQEIPDPEAGSAFISTSILRSEGFLSANRTNIAYSSLTLAAEESTKTSLVVDTTDFPEPTGDAASLAAILDLARKLSKLGGDKSGILTCGGVIKHENTAGKLTKVDLLFNVPYGYRKPRTVREQLLKGDQFHPLEQRLGIAQQLARSVAYLHIAKFVHKNIRPETILLLTKSHLSLGNSYLAGFERFRAVEGGSLKIGDSLWHKDLYRHPTRQGLRPEKEYVMQHDIYSLGVCLLEVGLWTSFIGYHDNKTLPKPGPGLNLASGLKRDSIRHSVPDWVEALETLPVQTSMKATDSENELVENWLRRASATKEVFTALATEVLPAKMGTKYADIVLSCLTCLDENNDDFGDTNDLKDNDGILVGTRYLEKISFLLQDISV